MENVEKLIEKEVKVLGDIRKIIDSRNFKSIDIIIKNERDESIYLPFNQDELIEFLKKQIDDRAESYIDNLKKT